jgi:hypothetical protein
VRNTPGQCVVCGASTKRFLSSGRYAKRCAACKGLCVRKQLPDKRECKHCESVFTPSHHRQVYCTRRCERVANARRHRRRHSKRSRADVAAARSECAALRRIGRSVRSWMSPVCKYCGKRTNGSAYCSDQCERAMNARRFRLFYAKSPAPPRRLSCQDCGTAFVVQGHQRNGRKYCAACAEARVRKGKKKQSRRHNAVRRARLAGAMVGGAFDTRDVFDRDGWKCQRCGCKTKPAIRHRWHPKQAECDHIIPLAVGGDHAIWNCQTLCARCNSNKGASVGGDQLLLAS